MNARTVQVARAAIIRATDKPHTEARLVCRQNILGGGLSWDFWLELTNPEGTSSRRNLGVSVTYRGALEKAETLGRQFGMPAPDVVDPDGRPSPMATLISTAGTWAPLLTLVVAAANVLWLLARHA